MEGPHPPIQFEGLVRRISDTQMVETVLELRHDEQLEEWTSRVGFEGGVRMLRLSDIELFGADDAVLWSDMERLQFNRASRAKAFRTRTILEKATQSARPLGAPAGLPAPVLPVTIRAPSLKFPGESAGGAIRAPLTPTNKENRIRRAIDSTMNMRG
jgi:hypothetical protein